MGIARSITRIPPIIVVVIVLALIGLSAWSLISTGGKKIEALAQKGMDKYDTYLPEITIKQGEASVNIDQPYYFDTGDQNFVVVIDTRDGKQNSALDYLKDVPDGLVLTKTGITVKNRQNVQIFPLKELPDMVLNSQNVRKMAQDYLPMVIRIVAVIIAFYFVFSKLFQMLMLALVPYIAARSYNTELTYGQSLKLSVAAMILPVVLDVVLRLSGTAIPGWLFFYVAIYIGDLVFLTIDVVRNSSSGMTSAEPINP